MMIISCPACSQRVSNKHHSCPKCGASMDGANQQGLPVDEAKRRQRQLRRGKLEMQGYLSILILVCGASWMYVSSDYLQNTPGFWPTFTMAAGAIWYLAVRVYGIFVR